MKSVKFLVSAIISGMLCIPSVFAIEGEKPGEVLSKNEVREQIVAALSDISAINQEITIKFMVSDKKSFELLSVEGESRNLVEVVKSELSRENISIPKDMEGVYSLKIRFSETEDVKVEDASTTMRNLIANALSDVSVAEPASVKLAFSVVNNKMIVKKVEGNNKAVVSSVESALENSEIILPAELAGNYQLTVKF